MADRYLKHIPSGVVYILQPAFAQRADFIEVANLTGDPLPDGKDEPVAETKSRGKRKSGEVVADTDAALSADASRGLAK